MVNLDRGSAPGMVRFADDSNNVLRGLGGDDLIFASRGRDIHDGGAGFDIVSSAYRDDVAGISASLRTDSAAYWGVAAFSTLVGIEGLIGSAGNDTVIAGATTGIPSSRATVTGPITAIAFRSITPKHRSSCAACWRIAA